MKQPLLAKRLGRHNKRIQLVHEEDLRSNRSVRSEFDYENKKKFLDVLSNAK